MARPKNGDPHGRGAVRRDALLQNQTPRLLAFVLSRPPDRVTYTQLAPLRKDFEEIEKLGLQAVTLAGTAHFEDYVDDCFAAAAGNAPAYDWSGH